MADPLIIVAIITLVGNILLNMIQYRNTLSGAKEKESIAASNLIDRALQVGKEEIQSLRSINADLIKANLEKDEKIKILYEKIKQLEEEVENLTKKVKALEEKK